jgi:hypothetical protein
MEKEREREIHNKKGTEREMRNREAEKYRS